MRHAFNLIVLDLKRLTPNWKTNCSMTYFFKYHISLSCKFMHWVYSLRSILATTAGLLVLPAFYKSVQSYPY